MLTAGRCQVEAARCSATPTATGGQWVPGRRAFGLRKRIPDRGLARPSRPRPSARLDQASRRLPAPRVASAPPVAGRVLPRSDSAAYPLDRRKVFNASANPCPPGFLRSSDDAHGWGRTPPPDPPGRARAARHAASQYKGDRGGRRGDDAARRRITRRPRSRSRRWRTRRSSRNLGCPNFRRDTSPPIDI